MIDLLSPVAWQMTVGERAALEGVLAQLKPALAIEIGTAEGGSLRRISAHSGHVHSFDLVEPLPEIRELRNVTLHTGDSHVLLAEFLGKLERDGANVDFALVDGDHTSEGVRQDLEALLSSSAVSRSVILIHDTANDVVRAGVESVRYGEYPRITHRDLDFVAGHLSEQGEYRHQLWGGLGLVVVDADGTRAPGSRELGFYPAFELMAAVRDGLAGAEREGRTVSPHEAVTTAAPDDAGRDERERELAEALDRANRALASIKGSASWRATAPLRELKQSIQGRRHR